MNKIIRLNGITKTYHSNRMVFEALHSLDLDIERGEHIAIWGPSGSGKTTLMQIIGCLSTPTAGSYSLLGKEVSSFTRDELAKTRNQHIGFIFQSFNLMPRLTAVDNVALPLVFRGMDVKTRTEKAIAILERLGLDGHLAHCSNELSGGQQQRVAIARALVTDPEIILADEPTGNLDSKSGEDVIKMLSELNMQGKTVIVITHDSNVAKHARRVIKILDGRIAN